MFQGYVKVDFMGFYGGFNDLLIVYSRVFSVISIIFPGCFVGVLRVLQGCLKGISREFEFEST